MNKISELVKAQRTSLGLTLEQLGEKAKLTQGYLSRVEKGDFDGMNMSLDTIIRLAHALKLKVKDFLDDTHVNDTNHTPELSVYLRQKYNINDSKDVLIIEELIKRLKDDEDVSS